MADQSTFLNIEDEMRSSFLEYAMSVIISRALPDVRDDLKPVHRRILFAMHQLKNTHAQPFKKSARVVGDVIGKYHPHGDSAVYDALVRLAQDFAMRYPLVDGQGNFGSVDGDSAAAMRYTEVRMDKLASQLLADLDKETVDWVPNYDEKELEPAVLPTRVPNILLNGAVGIAVGMATNIPPHNLTELVDACVALIDDPNLETKALLDIVKGPDFPTGGQILGKVGIHQAYATGRGSLIVRARADVETDAKGRESIIVTEIPYQVNKTRLIERIAQLVREKKLEGISDIQDYSDRTGMRIWIQVKRDADARVVLNSLYKNSDLQTSFGVNLIAIVQGRPQVITLRDCLSHFIDHRRTVVTRRCRYELRKAMERREIVEGIGVAIDAIDRIIAIIRAAKDPDEAKVNLMAEKLAGFGGFLERCERPQAEIDAARSGPYRLNERQAKAILDMRLQRLTGLEREKVEAEYRELCAEIERLEAILTDSTLLMAVIREELVEVRVEFGDPDGQGSGEGGPDSKGSRRTELVPNPQEIQAIDLVADESMVVMLTHNGYVKRLPTTEYRVQARGGVGVRGGTGRDSEDFVVEMFEASAHHWVLMFTDTGRVFRKRVFELPAGRRESRGKAMVNFLDLKESERVIKMVPYREDEIGEDNYVVLASRQGYVKRTSLKEFNNIRASGLIAASIGEDDQLIGAELTDGQKHVLMASAKGMAIRFAEDGVRPMGRTARGVKGMGMRGEDRVVSMMVIDAESTNSFLTLCENGYGKRTAAEEYRAQSRSGLGLITIRVNDRNGPVIGMLEVSEHQQLMVMTNRGKVIRTTVDGISLMGRSTQGVRIIRLADGEKVAVMETIDDDGSNGNDDPESSLDEDGDAEAIEASTTEETDTGAPDAEDAEDAEEAQDAEAKEASDDDNAE